VACKRIIEWDQSEVAES